MDASLVAASATAHPIKRVWFLGRQVPVLIQNENGPVRSSSRGNTSTPCSHGLPCFLRPRPCRLCACTVSATRSLQRAAAAWSYQASGGPDFHCRGRPCATRWELPFGSQLEGACLAVWLHDVCAPACMALTVVACGQGAPDANRQANIMAAIQVMPRLLVGLEVNVGFTR